MVAFGRRISVGYKTLTMPGHFTFFTTDIENGKARFDETETRHAIQALRYNVGDEISFTDGKGKWFTGQITTIRKSGFEASILQQREAENLPALKLAVGLIKHADRLEWLVEKCTELGVKELYFMITANTEKPRLNAERMNRVAISALKQSHGCRLPEIHLVPYTQVLALTAENKLICHCRQELQSAGLDRNSLTGNCLVLIGPEGDFTAEEVHAAHAAGFKDCLLGPLVLRTETAGMAVASAYLLSQNA